MVKKAFCVGVDDYPGEGNDLNGCVNDANDWADLLTKYFDFPQAAVRVVADSEATKANILTGIKDLLVNARSGDTLVFTISSHGTYLADTSEDEPTYDEAYCPYDALDGLILVDELRTLFSALADGVRLTVVSDSCFSGTVTRAATFLPVPDVRRVRFLNPRVLGGEELSPVELNRARSKWRERYPESAMKELLLSAAGEGQYATEALIGGAYHGAMTYFALRVIREANYKITYADLVARLTDLIVADFSQEPQLRGEIHNKYRQVFA